MTNISGGFGVWSPARWSTAFFVSLIFATSLLAQNGTVSFTEYSIPTSGSFPIGITNGPDGAVWFVERSKVGRISSDGTITEYPDAGGGYYMTNGPDGALWFTSNGKIKRITTSGEVSQFTLPSTSSDTWGIATGPDGAIWYTARSNGRIGRLTTSGAVTEYALSPLSYPQGITAGPDGALWFTEASGNRIGRITTDGTISVYSLPLSTPADIVTGPDGALWFTSTDTGKIGRITTAGAITVFPLLTNDSLRSIASSPDGFLWIAQDRRIVKMSTDGIVNEYGIPNAVPGSGSAVRQLIANPGGIIWFTDSSGRIGRMDSAANVSGATLVQSYSKGATGVPSISLPMGRTTAGNTILVFVRMSTTTQTVSISDTTGNSYLEATSQNQDQDEHQIHIFYAYGIVGGPVTVRADFSDNNDHPWLAAFEYSGIRSTNPLDQIARAQGFGTNDSSGNTPPTTEPYELLFAGTGQSPTTYDPVQAGPGYVLYQTDPGASRAAVEAIAVNTTGSYAAPFTTNDVQTWSAVLATFAANAPVASPSITTTVLPDGNQNDSYSAAVSASGGAAPFKWSIASGSLPPGMRLSSESGVISGSHSTPGNYSFTVTVSDANVQTASQALSISVGAQAPSIDMFGVPLPDGRRGTPYSSGGMQARGGTAPYTWSVISGNLPSGLILNSDGNSLSGINGTPAGSGVSNFTLQVTDSNSLSATKDLSITVFDWIEETESSVTFSGLWNDNAASPNSGGSAKLSMDAGARASFVFTGTQASWIGLKDPWSGIANIYLDGNLVATVDTYSNSSSYKSHLYTAGGLADTEHTLTIEATGTRNSISGGSWIWVDAFESLGSIGSGPIAPSIVTTAIPIARQNQTYTTSLIAMGGRAPYTWSFFGNVPAGMTLDANTGTLSGTPTATGWTIFTIQVTDSDAQSFYRKLFFTVIQPGLAVATSSLPSITQNGTYESNLSATGGTVPYTWSVVSGTLPGGLSLAPGGSISGTPDSAGTSNFTVQVADSTSLTAIKALSITINPTPVVTTDTLPYGTVNSFYYGTLAANLGTPPYTWSIVSGSLPPGLVIFGTNTANQIHGSPSAAGTSEFTVQVSDSSSQTATKSLSITVDSSFSIDNLFLPGGTKETAYSTTLTTSGGTAPYTWNIVSGTLNSGLSLGSSNGVISGTPNAGGVSNFTVRVADAQSQTATKAFSIYASDPGFAITTSSLPNGVQNGAYNATLSGSGGTAPYSWSIYSGTLPAGLTLNSASGEISGTPATTGTSSFNVHLADANGLSTTRSLTITVNLNAVTISTMSLPDGTQDAAYSATLTAAGGATPYSWSIASGSLPAGLSLDSSSGMISGTPQFTGTSNFTVQVTDASPQSATKQFSIVIQSSGGGSESYIEETHSSIVYSGGWYPNGGSFNSGGSAVLAMDAGSSATVHFTGTGITWIGYSDEWAGIANVYVDGEIQSTVDTYRSPAQNQASEYSIAGLAPGSHTLRIEVTETHSAGSSASWIWVDAFRIQP